MRKRSIVGPWGGFSNHVRWLALLDKQFNVTERLGYNGSIEHFIANEVYNDNRKWHNWLIYEWTWRDKIHEFIFLDNQVCYQAHKFVILQIDPELAYKCYFKFNPALNHLTKKDFIQMVVSYDHEVDAFPMDSLKLNAGVLYQETLDPDFYATLTKYLDLDDNYETAKDIHKLWYNLHKQAERDIITDIQTMYQ